MGKYLTSEDIVFVEDIPYKPFWFGEHMYFTNIYTGLLFKQTPIYLGDSNIADMSKLKNYFQENKIEFFNAKLISLNNKKLKAEWFMVKVKFYMKSGNIIEFECKEIELTRNGFDQLAGYSIDNGDSKKRLMDADINNIEGVVIEEI